MSSSVMELAKIMRNRESMQQEIQREMQNAMLSFSKNLNRRYMEKLQKAVADRHAKIGASPSREVQLLKVMGQFIPQNKQTFEQMIHTLKMLETMQSIRAELAVAPAVRAMSDGAGALPSSAEDSIHADGVYDIDQDCMRAKCASAAPHFGQMLLMLLFLNRSC